MPTVTVTLEDLKHIHLEHLRRGHDGVAAAVRDVAAGHDAAVGAVVAAIGDAADSNSVEKAVWASLVVRYLDSASSAGRLGDGLSGQSRSQSRRSSGGGA